MQKHPAPASGNGVSHTPLHYAAEVGAKALDAVRTGATWATTNTERVVHEYPLASVGIALGSGAILGWLAYRLLATRRPPR